MLLLGVADLISALLLMRGSYHISVPQAVIFFFAIYLFVKAVIFIADVGSWLDIITGVLLILSISHSLPFVICLIFALIVGLKGTLSIMAGAFH